jgi:hypothetical protein
MGAYASLLPWLVVAVAVGLMVRAHDVKFRVERCVVCGEKGEHLVGCPGRRGY